MAKVSMTVDIQFETNSDAAASTAVVRVPGDIAHSIQHGCHRNNWGKAGISKGGSDPQRNFINACCSVSLFLIRWDRGLFSIMGKLAAGADARSGCHCLGNRGPP